MESAAAARSASDAEDFVRFCYRRRRVGWPELYDEMCLVATRGTFRGMGRRELSEVGIGFSLFETRNLAELVTRVVAEEQAARARLAPRRGIPVARDDADGARIAEQGGDAVGRSVPGEAYHVAEPGPEEVVAGPRLVPAGAGA